MSERAGAIDENRSGMTPETTGEHTVKVLLDQGGVYPTMECGFDPADRLRPCWPHDENGEPFSDEAGAKSGCVYFDWMGEIGGESIVNEVELRFRLGSAVWNDDGFDFELGEVVQ